MARWKIFSDTFTKVTTCVVFGVAIYCRIFFPGPNFREELLWQILFVSLLTSAGALMYTDDIKKNSMKVRCIVHYLMVNVIVIGCGIWFGWFHTDNLAQVIGMLLLIAVIFGIVSFILWRKAAQEAQMMNLRLAEYQGKSEEAETEAADR